VVRKLLTALGVLVLAVVGVGVVLSLTNPSPRQAPAWEPAAPLPEARGEGAGAVVETPDGPRLAVVGGLTGFGRTSDEVAFYDPAADSWSSGPPLPDPRHHLAAAAIGETLYVSGGSPSGRELETPTPQLWALPGPDGDWESLEPLPQPRWGHRLVAVDERLFAVGGQPGPQVQIYEPGRGWSLGAPIPEVRDHLGVVALDGEIWVLGGRDEDRELTARVDVYDPEEDAWRPGPPLSAAVSAAAVGVVNGRIHVVDGEDPATFTGGVLDTHWVLDPDQETWDEAPSSRLAVHGAADGVIDDRLHVVGGAARQGALSVLSWTDEVQVFDPGS
jgi:hypothetical protein